MLRECILNLGRVKEAISQAIVGAIDAAGLDSWQEQMRGLKAGLLILGKTRAVEIVEAISVQLKRVMQPGGRVLTLPSLDRLADSIVSLEYYMETLQSGRADPWYMLDNAERSLQALEAEPTPVVPTISALLPPGTFAQTVHLGREAQTPAEPPARCRDRHAQAADSCGARACERCVLRDRRSGTVETLHRGGSRGAGEDCARSFTQWEQNPLEREALVTVRRSFHTLKGSGRMVGARELAEFAWSIESLVNRLLDNTLSRSQEVLATLRSAVATLPQLIDQLETGQAQAHEAGTILTRAQALAASQSAESVPAPPEMETESAAAQAPERALRTAGAREPTLRAQAAVAPRSTNHTREHARGARRARAPRAASAPAARG